MIWSMTRSIYKLTVLLIGLCVACTLAAQTEPDTSEVTQVLLDKSDLLKFRNIDGREATVLSGNVELRQDDMYMYCDSAIMIDNNVDASGNVTIQQGDSITIFADSLSYLGDIKKAFLFGDVALLKEHQKLHTDYLVYDLNNDIGTYYTWAVLTNDTTQLRSKKGYYYVREDIIYFKDSVTIVDPDFELKTDTLKYNTLTGVATFLGPTLINQGSGRIYCEEGYYDTKNSFAEFSNYPQYVKEDQQARSRIIQYDASTNVVTMIDEASFEELDKKARADTIRYDEDSGLTYLLGSAHYEEGEQVVDADRLVYNEETETFRTEGRARIVDGSQILDADFIDYESDDAIATGDVIWVDTAEEVTIKCQHLDYNKQTEHIVASGERPLLISLIDGDTFYMCSDTLVSFYDNPDDSLRTMLAYHDVRILKSNMQAIADSVTYSSRDSIFELFENPVIWSDTTQFISDTMYMQLANGKIDRILLQQKALILNSKDEVFFNQIKGKDITAFFRDDELRKMMVVGNAESIYYALDDVGAYVGVNKTVCSEMLMYFGDNQIQDIRFYAQPKANTYPMGQFNHKSSRLEGFRWETAKRPRTVKDLTRPKRPFVKPQLPKENDKELSVKPTTTIE